MKEVTFKLNIVYSQIAVFQCGMENPYNDWNDIHVKQGFAWRKGSVAFGTLSDNVESKISIKVSDSIELDKGTIRAIVVPFEIEKMGIELGSIIETIEIEINKGMYELLFKVKVDDSGQELYSFVFVKNDNPIPRILIADEGLEVPKDLLMHAEVAL